MALKDLWKLIKSDNKKVVDVRNNHQFSDEDREHAVEMRQIRQETARIREKMQLLEQKRELDELKSELYHHESDEDDDGQTKILEYLAPIMANMRAGNAAKGTQPPIQQSPPSQLSDDDIRSFIVKQKRGYVKLAKTMPKELLKRQISQQFPLSDDEFERAHKILVEEF